MQSIFEGARHRERIHGEGGRITGAAAADAREAPLVPGEVKEQLIRARCELRPYRVSDVARATAEGEVSSSGVTESAGAEVAFRILF